MSEKIKLIGIGDDGFEGLSKKVQSIILDAEIIMGGLRHLSMLPEVVAKKISWSKDLKQDIKKINEYKSKKYAFSQVETHYFTVLVDYY